MTEVPVIVVPLTAPVDATDDGVMSPSVRVIDGLVVAEATVPEMPFAVTTATDETPPGGAAHVLSPRRNVVDEAVPEEARRASGTVPLVRFVAFRFERSADVGATQCGTRPGPCDVST